MTPLLAVALPKLLIHSSVPELGAELLGGGIPSRLRANLLTKVLGLMDFVYTRHVCPHLLVLVSVAVGAAASVKYWDTKERTDFPSVLLMP